jgi:hypothetical protein
MKNLLKALPLVAMFGLVTGLSQAQTVGTKGGTGTTTTQAPTTTTGKQTDKTVMTPRQESPTDRSTRTETGTPTTRSDAPTVSTRDGQNADVKRASKDKLERTKGMKKKHAQHVPRGKAYGWHRNHDSGPGTRAPR